MNYNIQLTSADMLFLLEPPSKHEIQYLGAHAGRKRKQKSKERAESNYVQPSQPKPLTIPATIHPTEKVLSCEVDFSIQKNTSHNDNSLPRYRVGQEHFKLFTVGPLPILLLGLGCSYVRDDVLRLALLKQKRWGSNGSVEVIALPDVCPYSETVFLFSNSSNLDQEIESCIQRGLIVQSTSDDGSPEGYSLSDQLRLWSLPSCEQTELLQIGLSFLTYIYPRDSVLVPL